MTNFPPNIIDQGYFDLTKYRFIRSFLIGADLDLYFQDLDDNKKGFIIQLRTVIAIKDWSRGKNISTLRVDSDGSSFGHDIALRLQKEEYTRYNLLYLFEDLNHTSPIFRGLAKNIGIRMFDKENDVDSKLQKLPLFCSPNRHKHAIVGLPDRPAVRWAISNVH